MPTYKVTTPDGRSFNVTGPDGATAHDALEYAKTHAPAPELKEGWMNKAYRLMSSFAGAEDPHLKPGEAVAGRGEHPTISGAQDTFLSMLAEAPLLAAGGMAAGAAAPALGALAAPMGRVATQGALSTAKGEDVPHSLVDVAGAALGEVGAAGLGTLARKLGMGAAREGTRAAEAARIGKAGGEVLPELGVESDKELWGAAQQWGSKQVERVLQPALNEIGQRLGGARTLLLPSQGDKPLSFASAVKAMFDAQGPTRREISQEIQAALAGVDKGASELFRAAMEARAAGHTYLGVLRKGMDASGTLHPEKIAAYVNKNYSKLQNFAGKYWPQLEQALLGPGKSAPTAIAPKPDTTRLFGHKIATPPSVAAGAQKAGEAALNPAVRATVDAAFGTPPYSGLAISALGSVPRRVLRHVPGGHAISDVLDDKESDDEGGR